MMSRKSCSYMGLSGGDIQYRLFAGQTNHVTCWLVECLFVGAGSPNQSLELTLLSRILLRLVLSLWHFKSSLVTLRQPQGGSAPSRYAACHKRVSCELNAVVW